MYRTDVENIPLGIREYLLELFDYSSLSELSNEIISLNEKRSTKFDSNKIVDALYHLNLPNFWIITLKENIPEADVIYIIFENILTSEQEDCFFKSLPRDLIKVDISEESLSTEYSIY